jgi:hypothetical protein
MKLIGRIVCLFKGHRRGKFAHQGIVIDGARLRTYRCERCGAEWRRKIKAQDQNNGTPGDES